MIKKHIAIVDDDTEIRQMLGEYLSNQGFQISFFENGLLLVEAISEHKFRCDLIVLDIMMPQLDGLETCRRIRYDDNQVPIIMLTSVAEDVDRIMEVYLFYIFYDSQNL
ncbi:response regulator [Facilibium subflavum]|uniref:response regulator n=1 Tax=Facilibium subflavum TaxID=2219058 RepID=UPI000E65EAB5|nr:response regulator [Facilibium subflavum]